MILEPKHIIPYLPYSLNWDISETMYGKEEKNRLKWCKVVGINLSENILFLKTNIISQNDGKLFLDFGIGKPMLRPLTDLINKIKIDGEEFIPIEKFGLVPNECNLEFMERVIAHKSKTYEEINLLFQWNFDVFDLISYGLAVVY
jgi:hypothetical protein